MAVPLPERPGASLRVRGGAGTVARFPVTHGGRLAPVAPTASTPALGPAQVRHNWLLYAFLFFLPLQNLQTGYMPNLGGGFNFLNIGFALALLGAWYCRGHITHWSTVHRWVVLYMVWSFVTLWIGYMHVPGDTAHRFNDLKDSMLGVMIIFLVQMSVNDWSTLKRVILMMILPLPYILRVTWYEHQSVSSWHYSDDLRIQGTFSLLGANEYASFCVTMALVLFALLLACKFSKVWRALLVGGITCMVLGVLWAYSRTAYVTILVGAVSILLLWRGRWKMIIPLVLAVAIVPNFLPHAVTERFDSTHVEASKADESTDLRYQYWDVAWDVFLAHPVVGVGAKTFAYVNPYQKDTHNLFIREMAEEGLIGIFILAGLFISILRASWRTMRDSPTGSLGYALGLGMIGAWLALAIGNFWGDRFTYTQMIGYFWAFLALTLKARELTLAERADVPATLPSTHAKVARG